MNQNADWKLLPKGEYVGVVNEVLLAGGRLSGLKFHIAGHDETEFEIDASIASDAFLQNAVKRGFFVLEVDPALSQRYVAPSRQTESGPPLIDVSPVSRN